MVAGFDATQWAVMLLSALLIGISKTGIPGIGILAIPLMAAVMPARLSTGFILPMLITADIIAVTAYRRQAVWRHLIRLFPWAVLGVVAGWAIMGRIGDRQLQPLIGAIILCLMAINLWKRRRGPRTAGGAEDAPPSPWWFPAGMGLLAGTTTMLANAAGPIMVIYLVAMRLPKTAFIGTGAWYFLLLNVFKLPFSAGLGLITPESLRVNLMLSPVIVLGALAGMAVLPRIPQRGFVAGVELLAGLAAMRLLIP